MYARLNQKPTLSLNIPIFDENLKPGSIYEILGKSGSGKTTILYEILCKLLLPNYIDKSLNVGVIFIDNDRHFNLRRLGTLLELKCKKNAENNSLDVSKIAAIVRDCLRRLVLLSCDDSEDFLHALDHIEKNLFKNRHLASVLIVDSISAFVLFDQCDENSTLDREKLHKIHQNYVQKLKRLAIEINLIVIVTQFMLTLSDENGERNKFNETSSIGVMDKCWRNAVHLRIQLDNIISTNEQIFTAQKIFSNGKLGELLCKFKMNQNMLYFVKK